MLKQTIDYRELPLGIRLRFKPVKGANGAFHLAPRIWYTIVLAFQTAQNAQWEIREDHLPDYSGSPRRNPISHGNPRLYNVKAHVTPSVHARIKKEASRRGLTVSRMLSDLIADNFPQN